MGFAAAVSVPDGVAFAADSRLEAGVGEGPPAVMSDTQQKIVPLSPLVAALIPETHVLSPELTLNVRSVLDQLRPDLARDAKLEEIISELPGRFVTAAGIDRERAAAIQLKIIGYSEKERAVQVIKLDGLSNAETLHSTTNPGVDWFGFVDVATRVVRGVSSLAKLDRDAHPQYLIPTPLMSLEDAIDLAETLVGTTAIIGKFVRAVIVDGKAQPVSFAVGGMVQSAVLTTSGFRWVSKPQWIASSATGLPIDPRDVESS